LLECVINISEGRSDALLSALARSAGGSLLDLHHDPHHHRSVFTLAGPEVEPAARALTTEAVARLDLRDHDGVHPRFGVVDVVPFVPLDGAAIGDALAARDAFARWAGTELGLPCFLYGPERPLPDLRRGAFTSIAADTGPATPHPSAGACAVGARPVLVAYNLWLVDRNLDRAKTIAASLRTPEVRALGLETGDAVQVSCNLIEPDVVGPAEVYDRVAAQATVARAELVGLVPASVLSRIPRSRWVELDLADDRTIENRIRR
jgi:glutamate formiminotransferase